MPAGVQANTNTQDIINDFPKKATNTDDVGYENFVPNWNGHVTSKTNKTEVQANPLGVSSSASVSSAFQSKPTYDRSYFRNKTLDQYPNLCRKFSSENFDYYGITDETSCPLCSLDHDDDDSIEGRYKAESYFIKCERHEIKIVAQSHYFTILYLLTLHCDIFFTGLIYVGYYLL